MYDNINSPAYQLQWCMLLSQLLSVYRSRAAKWIGYYWLFPDIIGYFPKLINFWMAKMYGNNCAFRGGTKIWKQYNRVTKHLHN